MKETSKFTRESNEKKSSNQSVSLKQVTLPSQTHRTKTKSLCGNFVRRRTYTATILNQVGIDTSNLPKDVNFKLIKRKSKEDNEDT